MSNVSTTELIRLVAEMPSGIDHLIVSASYEERAFGVWAQIQHRVPRRKYICYNANHESYLRKNVERFRDINPNAQVVKLDSNEPPVTFDAIKAVIDGLRAEGVCHLGIDVTGFTREALAMLVYLARWRLAEGSTVTAFYHRATKYGRTPKKGWLSQGVREVRSVLGYAGQMRLSANTHLLMIAGFETERAQEIIDTIEPTSLGIGMIVRAPGGAEEENPHDAPLREFTARVKSFYAGAEMKEFPFSSSDPIFTRDEILRLAKQSSRNVVVACLNSKPAMIGACLAAMEYPMIQLVYAQPLYYNTTHYSEPSGRVQFFTVPINA